MIGLVSIRLRPKIFGSLDLRRSLFWTVQELRLRRRHRNQFEIAQRAGRHSHESGILLGEGGGNVRASRVRALRGAFAPTLRYRARTSESEREQNQPILLAAKTRIKDMAPPKKIDKVRKLVPLKVLYEEF